MCAGLCTSSTRPSAERRTSTSLSSRPFCRCLCKCISRTSSETAAAFRTVRSQLSRVRGAAPRGRVGGRVTRPRKVAGARFIIDGCASCLCIRLHAYCAHIISVRTRVISTHILSPAQKLEQENRPGHPGACSVTTAISGHLQRHAAANRAPLRRCRRRAVRASGAVAALPGAPVLAAPDLAQALAEQLLHGASRAFPPRSQPSEESSWA